MIPLSISKSLRVLIANSFKPDKAILARIPESVKHQCATSASVLRPIASPRQVCHTVIVVEGFSTQTSHS